MRRPIVLFVILWAALAARGFSQPTDCYVFDAGIGAWTFNPACGPGGGSPPTLPLAVKSGGTGSTTAAGARSSLGAAAADASTSVNGEDCALGSSCTVGAAPTGPASGDLSGTYPAPVVSKVNGAAVPSASTVVGTNASGQLVDASASTLANDTTGRASGLSAAYIDWSAPSGGASIINKPSLPAPSQGSPAMDGAASPGLSAAYARADHVHPSDASRATWPPAGVPASTGSAWGQSYTVGTGAGSLLQLDGSGMLFLPVRQNLSGPEQIWATDLPGGSYYMNAGLWALGNGSGVYKLYQIWGGKLHPTATWSVPVFAGYETLPGFAWEYSYDDGTLALDSFVSSVTGGPAALNQNVLVFRDGNVGIGTRSFGTNAASVLGFANATPPASGALGTGGQLYVENGALKYRGSSGTVTVLANP